MTKTEAVAAIRENARDLITPERATEIAEAFGYDLKTLGIKPRAIRTFTRANYAEGRGDVLVVAVQALAPRIAILTGAINAANANPYHSPYNGAGKHAQHVSDRNAQALETHFDLASGIEELTGSAQAEYIAKRFPDHKA